MNEVCLVREYVVRTYVGPNSGYSNKLIQYRWKIEIWTLSRMMIGE